MASAHHLVILNKFRVSGSMLDKILIGRHYILTEECLQDVYSGMETIIRKNLSRFSFRNGA